MKKRYVLYQVKYNAYYGRLMWHTKGEYIYSLVKDIREAKKFTKNEVLKTLEMLPSNKEFEIKEIL